MLVSFLCLYLYLSLFRFSTSARKLKALALLHTAVAADVKSSVRTDCRLVTRHPLPTPFIAIGQVDMGPDGKIGRGSTRIDADKNKSA